MCLDLIGCFSFLGGLVVSESGQRPAPPKRQESSAGASSQRLCTKLPEEAAV